MDMSSNLQESLQLEHGRVQRVELVLRETRPHQELLEEVLVRQVRLEHQRDQLGCGREVRLQLTQVGDARVGEDLLGGGDGLGDLGLDAVDVLNGRAAGQVEGVEESQGELQEVRGQALAVQVRVVRPLVGPDLAPAI